MYKLAGLIIFLFINCSIFSQIGGNYTYAFLNQTNSARIAALGGKSVSLADEDLNMPFHNPALLSDGMDNNMVLNYIGYFADINYGYASYSRSYENVGNFAAGIHYLNYGSFEYADIYGIRSGTFNASEYALNLIYSRKLDSLLTVGINLKPVYTVFERYNSIGLVFDVGVNYYNPDNLFSTGLVIRNVGGQITKYYSEGIKEKVPFEIQAGFSQKLAHAPFRFSVTLHQLQRWDLQYESELDEDDVFLEEEKKETTSDKLGKFSDNLLRHAIIGMEFMPGENFYVALGYNYQRRQELKLNIHPAMVGFSWGFGLKLSKFHISYGRATYHLSGASNHFSISTNLSEFYRKLN